jgi:hypothetical protein
MKLNMRRNVLFITVVLITAVFLSCQKGDGDTAYGNTVIYMPQATSTGGLNCNYLVPSGAGISTYNFQIDSVNHKLNVILGVLRSGKESAEGYSVDIKADNDTTNLLIANNAISNGVLLPSSSYTLPAKIVVPAGKNSASFYLSINDADLNNAIYTGKNIALAIRIANPSNYTLNAKYSKTIVIINANTIRPLLK